MSFNDYLTAAKYMNEGLIRPEDQVEKSSLTPKEWMVRFLELIGNPQKAYPAIHIAGTSGKGSIATMIAHILKAAGLKVGLHTSPYLQSMTEKTWVNGRYIDSDDFTAIVNWLKPYIESFKTPEIPIHGLASLALSLEHFKRQEVDIAVIETGVGGRDDVTNVLNSVATVVGAIGFDHEKSLGNTLEEIARHKFGIAKKDVPLIFVDGEFTKIAEEVAAATGARLEPLYLNRSFERLTDDPQDNRFNYHGILSLNSLFPALDGSFQSVNAALAVSACEQAMLMLGQSIGEKAIRDGLWDARLPARLEVMKRRPRVILDGAHNPQKMAATLKVLCADRFRGKLIAVIGMLASKNAEAVADILAEYSKDAIVTAPIVYGKKALPPEELAAILEKRGVMVRVVPDPDEALENAIAYSHGDDRILVTGSLYLAGQLRNHYYALDKIVDNCTSWPR